MRSRGGCTTSEEDQLTAREERLGKNEVVLRDINDRIREGTTPSPDERAIFLCECGRDDCEETVAMTAHDYEVVRSDPRRFFLVPGHEIEEVERVVEERERYSIAEKFGAAGDIAAENDPSAD